MKVLKEKVSGALALDARPALSAAIDHLRLEDMLTVQEVDRLECSLPESLLVLNDLFSRGIAVKGSTGSPSASTPSAR